MTPTEVLGNRAEHLRVERRCDVFGLVRRAIEVLGEPSLELTEVPAHRWHRWVPIERAHAMGPIPVPLASAHTGLRAPFAFPNGTTIDLVVTPSGWGRRH